ncbi:MAG TPA: hypothetical protein PLF40_21230 [Kofleriaceae bacterium]|nr:hypothetical protein [Kofleriaceae bacterium]
MTERDVACATARELAQMTATQLLVEQRDLDRYLERLHRAIVAEPLLAHSRHWHAGFESTTLVERAAEVNQAWADGRLAPARSELAQLFADVGAVLVSSEVQSDNHRHARTRYTQLFNPRILALQLSAFGIDVWRYGPEYQAYDSTATWDVGGANGNDEATLTLEADVQVQDVNERWKRHFRAIISPTDVRVFDMGGDAYPDGIGRSPTTMPL